MSPPRSQPQLVLASGSTARRAMLAAAGLAVKAVAPKLDEAPLKAELSAAGAGPQQVALALAAAKAEAVLAQPEASPDWLAIAADQVLTAGGDWFDKPPDLPAARRQLLALRGRSHVLTSAVVLRGAGCAPWQAVDRAELRMRAFGDAWLDRYLAAEGEKATGSVGAYRLEGPGVQLFDTVQGDWFTILGLPLLPLLAQLRALQVLPS